MPDTPRPPGQNPQAVTPVGVQPVPGGMAVPPPPANMTPEELKQQAAAQAAQQPTQPKPRMEAPL